MMGRFYLDIEFTNGNYYLSDIIEIALLAEDSGYAFHSYVKLHYTIPKRVKLLTNIQDKTMNEIGLSFTKVIQELIEFIQHEQLHSLTNPIIIAHGGHLQDFPILLANCMKHRFVDYKTLEMCKYVDSMQVLQNQGYDKKPGLDALCVDLYVEKRMRHSALGDAELLKTVCNKQPLRQVLNQQQYGYTFTDILYHLNEKLPISIAQLYDIAVECSSYQDLESILYKYATKKTALNANQVCKVAYWYFRDRFIYTT